MTLRITALLLVFCLAGPASASPEQTVVDGVTYLVIRATPDSVRILWKDTRGVPLRTFPAAVQHLRAEGVTAQTMMNGGIFEPGGAPSGLLIQEGTELRPVNRKDGDGNFFLKPNGIFLIGTTGAAIVPTEVYPLGGVQLRYAVQSGPLLLQGGTIHPKLSSDSASRLHRNGVGTTKSGDVVLVITDPTSAKLPNLHEFARLFLSLGCGDAIFLDGIISQMRSGADITKPSNSFGTIIAITGSETKSGAAGVCTATEIDGPPVVQAPPNNNGSRP